MRVSWYNGAYRKDTSCFYFLVRTYIRSLLPDFSPEQASKEYRDWLLENKDRNEEPDEVELNSRVLLYGLLNKDIEKSKHPRKRDVFKCVYRNFLPTKEVPWHVKLLGVKADEKIKDFNAPLILASQKKYTLGAKLYVEETRLMLYEWVIAWLTARLYGYKRLEVLLDKSFELRETSVKSLIAHCLNYNDEIFEQKDWHHLNTRLH